METTTQLPKVTDIVLSGPDNPVAPPNVLGVVVRLDYNDFLGKKSLVVVFENRAFAEYVDDDIGSEIVTTSYSYPPLNGVDFSDANITKCIKEDVFTTVFSKIREKLN